jgi:DNA helicase-2/ATP-dependent DNA helicase PcrA
MDDLFDLIDNDEDQIISLYKTEENTNKTYETNQETSNQKPNWLDQLNKEQRQAVETTEGPVLVLSGAGTGKTKVLTTRLAYILSSLNAQPWNCLVVTFTNRAAKEMTERVRSMIGSMADDVWLGTFHAICTRILRNHAELIGLKSNFTILGDDDQKRVIKQILESLEIDPQKNPPVSFLERIQRWKDKGLNCKKTLELHKDDAYNQLSLKIYKLYQERLFELNAVDFGDIILHCLDIFMENPDILQKYQDKFKYIMVDEYQDTNVTQYLWLRLLSQKHKNICCVGDDDQSIYSWRGAEVENILKFENDFENAKIVRLEQNYRSTANILAAASTLITNNDGRLGKTLKVAENSPAKNTENAKIQVINVWGGEDEAKYVTEKINILARDKVKFKNIAVLVRTAFQTREFEEKFISEAIPYKVVGGPKFYERAEIRDALSYFRVILQSSDDLAFERIINKPTRGAGAKTLDLIRMEAKNYNTSLYQATKKLLKDNLLKGKAKTELSKLMDNFTSWRRTLGAVPAHETANNALEDSGYMNMLQNDKSPEAPGRIDNLKELIGVIADKYENLAEFMEHVSLVMEKDEKLDDDKVMLMTLHSAKGLEFDYVFLPGWEDGIFPHSRSIDEGGQTALEEERRLAYVAITRARKMLHILMANNRMVYGQWQNNIPSRFIDELPEEHIHVINSAGFGGSGKFKRKSKQSFRDKHKADLTTYDDDNRFSYVKDPEYVSNWQTSSSNAKKKAVNARSGTPAGSRVFHQKFGYGTVIKVEGNKLEVKFDNSGTKKLMSNFVNPA